MPMINCAECGAQVSTKAKACPACGAGQRDISPKKRGGCLTALVALLALGVVGSAVSSFFGSPPKSPAEQAADTKRGGAVYDAVQLLKSQLRDPESLTIEAAWVDPDGQTVCIAYGAKNGFGGQNRERLVVVDHGGLTTKAAWNKHCTGSDMSDVTFAARHTN